MRPCQCGSSLGFNHLPGNLSHSFAWNNSYFRPRLEGALAQFCVKDLYKFIHLPRGEDRGRVPGPLPTTSWILDQARILLPGLNNGQILIPLVNFLRSCYQAGSLLPGLNSGQILIPLVHTTNLQGSRESLHCLPCSYQGPGEILHQGSWRMVQF